MECGPDSNNQIAEISPLQILALDQLDLPVPLSALELLFARNRFIRPLERLDINQPVNTVCFDERRAFAVTMLLLPFRKRIGHPDIQGPVPPAREDVNVIHAPPVVPANAGTHTA